MTKKIPVTVLNGLDLAGQRFIQLLNQHPWFEVTGITVPDDKVGKAYADVVSWRLSADVPEKVAEIKGVSHTANVQTSLIFSALREETDAKTIENGLAKKGHAVITLHENNRMGSDVPLIIPEVNPEHVALIEVQKKNNGRTGFIVATPNAASINIGLPLKIFQTIFGLKKVLVTNMQAMSDMNPLAIAPTTMLDNILPHIDGEASQVELEVPKFLGTIAGTRLRMAPVLVSAQSNRVPVIDGHLASVSVELDKLVRVQEAIDALENFTPPTAATGLPSSPEWLLVYRFEESRPQPRLDKDVEKGMAWSVGHLHNCAVLHLRFMVTIHNMIRGGAGNAILIAEMLKAQGTIS